MLITNIKVKVMNILSKSGYFIKMGEEKRIEEMTNMDFGKINWYKN